VERRFTVMYEYRLTLCDFDIWSSGRASQSPAIWRSDIIPAAEKVLGLRFWHVSAESVIEQSDHGVANCLLLSNTQFKAIGLGLDSKGEPDLMVGNGAKLPKGP